MSKRKMKISRKSLIVIHPILIAGHKTSISVEDAFWKGLKEIARGRDMTLPDPSLRLLTAALIVAMLCVSGPTFAQGVDPKATEKPPAADAKDAAKKADEFAEAEKLLGSPAANPECLWLGRRVVSLLWRDDLA
jgi:Ribbon-helix-helix domain